MKKLRIKIALWLLPKERITYAALYPEERDQAWNKIFRDPQNAAAKEEWDYDLGATYWKAVLVEPFNPPKP